MPINNIFGILPETTIACAKVLYPPIVRDALEYARANGVNMTYKQMVHSWAFGTFEISNNPNLTSIDREVHAIGAFLHNLGWDLTPGSKLISSNKKFEVDGAIGVRSFIHPHPEGKKWEECRVRLAWGNIAVHTTPSCGTIPIPEIVFSF